MGKTIILGIQIQNRSTHAKEVQGLLTEYGCNIKTRIGLHEVNNNACSPDGILVLEMFGEINIINELENKLKNISGVVIKKMEFDL